MAANPINIVTALTAVQYDGTNSSDIVALDPGFTLNNQTEVGGVWSFNSPPDSTFYTVDTNDYIVFGQNQVFYVWTPAEYELQYQCNITCEDLDAALSGALAEVPGGEMIRAYGVGAVPTLLLSTSADVDVTLQPAMPDTSFTAYANKFASVSLVDLAINSVTIIDEDTVRVNVSNTGLVTLAGASVSVHAVA